MNLHKTPEGREFILDAKRDPDAFDASREPLRALRDLVVACEALGFDYGFADPADKAILARAQEGLTRLRYLFGDERAADAAAYGPLREPGDIITALRHARDELVKPGEAAAHGIHIFALIDAALKPPLTGE